jgi:copper chaperone CopZ
MKNTVKPFLCSFVLIAFLSIGVKAGVKPKTDVVTIQTSAVCEQCKARIEKALKATPGVVSANLNIDNKKVKVKYDASQVSPDQIRTAIANVGYSADGVKANTEAFGKLPGCCQKAGGKCEGKM